MLLASSSPFIPGTTTTITITTRRQRQHTRRGRRDVAAAPAIITASRHGSKREPPFAVPEGDEAFLEFYTHSLCPYAHRVSLCLAEKAVTHHRHHPDHRPATRYPPAAQALREDNVRGATSSAHRCAGSAKQVGAVRIWTLMKALEKKYKEKHDLTPKILGMQKPPMINFDDEERKLTKNAMRQLLSEAKRFEQALPKL